MLEGYPSSIGLLTKEGKMVGLDYGQDVGLEDFFDEDGRQCIIGPLSLYQGLGECQYRASEERNGGV